MKRWIFWGIVLGVIALGTKTAISVSQVMQARRRKYQSLFDTATTQYRLPAGLLMKQGEAESALDPTARSNAGAVGIMQIIPKWHPILGEAGALDPTQAIPYAAKLLRGWYDQFGSWSLALAAYNAGPGNVTKYGGIPPFPETQAYVKKILGV